LALSKKNRFELLREFESVFKTALAHESGDPGVPFKEKNRGSKISWYSPFNPLSHHIPWAITSPWATTSPKATTSPWKNSDIGSKINSNFYKAQGMHTLHTVSSIVVLQNTLVPFFQVLFQNIFSIFLLIWTNLLYQPIKSLNLL
jgi:hypothetical protein